MEPYYIIVSVIALIFLLLLLGFMWFLMYYRSQNSDTTFPPNVNNCPDYWLTDNNGNCLVPAYNANGLQTNTGLLYTQNSNNKIALNTKLSPDGKASAPGFTVIDNSGNSFINFKNGWTSLAGGSTCAQRAWANSYNIVWDGITNYNSC